MQTVLVVEDEWAIADWLSAVLGDEGYAVLVATNGQRALDVLKDHKVDLLISDFMMPIMDGPSLMRAVQNSDHAGIPVILMSSLPEASVAARCTGYYAFMRKPFRIADLLRIVRGALDSARPPGG